MSNIRGIDDLENDRNVPGQNNQMPLLGSGLVNGEDPRKESFFRFIKNFFCPLSTFKSFIFIISMLEITVYIVTLCFGIGLSTSKRPMLLPPLESILEYGSLVKLI